MAIGYNKIFVDTAIFIYYFEKHLLEKHPLYFDTAKVFFGSYIKSGKTVLTSVVTVDGTGIFGLSVYAKRSSAY